MDLEQINLFGVDRKCFKKVVAALFVCTFKSVIFI